MPAVRLSVTPFATAIAVALKRCRRRVAALALVLRHALLAFALVALLAAALAELRNLANVHRLWCFTAAAGPDPHRVNVVLDAAVQVRVRRKVLELQFLADLTWRRLDHNGNLHVVRQVLAAARLVSLDIVVPFSQLLPELR